MKIITLANIILVLLILLPMQLTYADAPFSIANKSSDTARVAYAVYVSESNADTIGINPGGMSRDGLMFNLDLLSNWRRRSIILMDMFT